ncbi:MAG: SCP2 sterol-binding domain-containing protein [Pseudomonadales bacterium]
MLITPPRPLLHRLGRHAAARVASLAPFLSRLPPVPLAPLQPILNRLLHHILQRRPELANRLGDRIDSLFMIDATNLPMVLLLRINPAQPLLMAAHRHHCPEADAKVTGELLMLMDMVDGRLDGDALFFNRELAISGDTEAVVCLRNALDDLEGSILDDIADFFGMPGRHALKIMRRYRTTDVEVD